MLIIARSSKGRVFWQPQQIIISAFFKFSYQNRVQIEKLNRSNWDKYVFCKDQKQILNQLSIHENYTQYLQSVKGLIYCSYKVNWFIYIISIRNQIRLAAQPFIQLALRDKLINQILTIRINYHQIIKMKEENFDMIDQRVQFLQRWLTPASSHESRDHTEFLDKLFALIQTDYNLQQIFIANCRTLLFSRQTNLSRVFQYCLQQKKKDYTKQISVFLREYLNERNQINISEELETYIIHNIWKESLYSLLKNIGISPIRIVEYLCLKMRSLKMQTRIQAISSAMNIISQIVNGWSSQFTAVFASTLPQMIQKENYGKQVCYSRGVLLQILQDQFCHIKKKGIQILGVAQSFLNPSMIRPLLLYMLNDEHQIVRQTCLNVLSRIPSLDIEKEDLSALLVCLKQNNQKMRSNVYENLSHITVTSSEDFLIILQKLYHILSIRPEDKKKIYIVCSKLGRKYRQFTLENLDKIYKFNDTEEPNWKSQIYRARFITVASIGADKWPSKLPQYFNNHYLYLRDVLLYAFQDNTKLKPNNFNEMSEQITDIEPTQIFTISVNLVAEWQIYHFLQAGQSMSLGLLKSIFKILVRLVEQTKMFKMCHHSILVSLIRQIERLEVLYNLYDSKLCQNLQKQLYQVISECKVEKLRDFCLKLRQRQVWLHLQKIQPIIFKVSTIDRSKIVISRIPQILKRSFIEFSNTINTSSDNSTNQPGYFRMSGVELEDVNEKIFSFRLKVKCKQIKCFILYSNPPLRHITNVHMNESWLEKLIL